MLAIAVIVLSTLFLVLGALYDIKTTEVPDRFSVGLVAVILFASGLHSLYLWDYSFMLTTFALGATYLIIGLILFHLGQWGGGDVKVFAGIGCVLGYLNSIQYAWVNSRILPFYVVYFINLGLVAIPCIVLYTLVVGVRNKSLFPEFFAETRRRTFALMVLSSLLPSVVALNLGMSALAMSYLILPFFVVLSLYLKVSERILFRRTVRVEDLRGGDVLAEDIVLGGVRVFSKSSMEGLDERQLGELRRLHLDGKVPGEVRLKMGVVFVPIYLLAFLTTVFVGNPVEMLLYHVL